MPQAIVIASPNGAGKSTSAPALVTGISFVNADEVDRRVRAAIRATVADHKWTGDPIAIWRDGQVVLLPPEQIELPEPAVVGREDFG